MTFHLIVNAARLSLFMLSKHLTFHRLSSGLYVYQSKIVSSHDQYALSSTRCGHGVVITWQSIALPAPFLVLLAVTKDLHPLPFIGAGSGQFDGLPAENARKRAMPSCPTGTARPSGRGLTQNTKTLVQYSILLFTRTQLPTIATISIVYNP